MVLEDGVELTSRALPSHSLSWPYKTKFTQESEYYLVCCTKRPVCRNVILMSAFDKGHSLELGFRGADN